MLGEVPACPGQRRQVAHVIGLVAGHAAQRLPVQQYGTALEVTQQVGIEPCIEQPRELAGVVGDDGHHAATAVQRRFEAQHHHVIGIRAQAHFGHRRQVGTLRIRRQEGRQMAADPVLAYMSKPEIEAQIKKVQNDMDKAAKELDFVAAARLRDEMFGLKKLLEGK